MNEPTPILRVTDLRREVNIEGAPRAIVDNISTSFETAAIYSILGPSGAGKSSLLRLLNRLDEPTSGKVIFEGENYHSVPPCKLRQQIGYLFQVPYMFPDTVADNLRYADPDLSEARLDQLLELVSISPSKRNQSVQSLSVGERQRVALARLLTTDPKVVLLDEPTAALDPTHADKIEATVKCLAVEKKITVIMVSHNPTQAIRMGGTGLLIVAGKLVEQADVTTLVENPQTDLGRRYRDRELT